LLLRHAGGPATGRPERDRQGAADAKDVVMVFHPSVVALL